jgi:molecular chaperone DnaK (HSP70)
LNILTFVDRATAAVIHYKLDSKVGSFKYFMFHLGGTSMEMTLFQLTNGSMEYIESTTSNFGGQDFDKRLMGHIMV